MPRKRATRTANAENKRPTPVMPDGDEGKDMDLELKKEKVQTLILDFKTEVDKRIRNMKASVVEMLNQIDLAFTMEMMQIPPHVRQMKLSDFLKDGGSFEETTESRDLHENIQSVLQSQAVVPKSGTLATVSENGDETVEPGTSKRTRRRKNVANAPPPTTSKRGTRSRKVCETPSNRETMSMAWPTPLVTPKFDPRLYRTPAVQSRFAKAEEVIMSMDGSPLENPLVNLKLLAKNDVNIDHIDVSSLDKNDISVVMSKIEMMHAKLKAISGLKTST